MTMPPSKNLPKINNADGTVNLTGVAFYQEECVFDLGCVCALIFFAYSTLRSSYSYQHLKTWASQLQEAIGGLSVKFRQPRIKNDRVLNPAHLIKLTKLNIPFWGKSSPFLYIPVDDKKTLGLDYRILNANVEGVSSNGSAWQGNVAFIYEAKTNTLLHHYLLMGGSTYSVFEQLISLIDKADAVVCKKLGGVEYIDLRKTLWLPMGFSGNNQSLSAYEEVFKIFKDQQLLSIDKAARNFDPFGNLFQALDLDKNSPWAVVTREAKAKANIEFDKWDVHQYSDSNFAYQVNTKIKSVPLGSVSAPYGSVKKPGYIIDGNDDLGMAINRLLKGVAIKYKKNRINNEQEKLYTDWIDSSSVTVHDKWSSVI